MTKAQSVDEILDFAIAREIEAQDFYRFLAKSVDKPNMMKLFDDFAAQEAGHQAKLEAVKAGGNIPTPRGEVPDLKLADYLVEVDISGELDYQAALVVAMHREKAAFRLYTDLAESTDSPDLKQTFTALAQEEARHKLYLETEYDDKVLADN